MLDAVLFLLPPLVACIILVGIHGYFGLHVLARGVIFVDISMAQIAALGTIVGMLAGVGPESGFSYIFSILFVLCAALVFTFIKLEHREVPQEAVIGVVYGLSVALSLLIAEVVPEGSGYIEETISGSLLWVTWGKIISCGLVYTAIGAFHYVYRDKFIALSRDENGRTIPNAGLWNFLFFATFGLVLVHSVKIGGVFLVFTLLVVPASISLMFFENWKKRIIVGWVIGVILSMLGALVSYKYNLPNGPTIVCLLGLALIAAALVKISFSRR